MLGVKSEIANKYDLCVEGVDMYFDNFYFTGEAEN